MGRRRRKQEEQTGRYFVEEKQSPSYHGAVALAVYRAHRDKRTVYVRVVGDPTALGRAEYDAEARVTTYIPRELEWVGQAAA